jgi:phosphoglucosamine mutase
VCGQRPTLAQLLADVTLFPQTADQRAPASPVPGLEGQPAKLAEATRAVEAELGDTGRVLIRASGTEPLLRVMVEARDAAQARSAAQRIAAAAQG